ncbi:MAG: PEP-CTERM sorting domain-containing protein [Fimbriimonadaceae bacterium]|jgi:hypothetical protein|nr:PEP-CTERM sorting domain-containing protein [Fimbriimonadaceae bacterium]
MKSNILAPVLLASVSLAAFSNAQQVSFNIPNAQNPGSGSSIGISNAAGTIKSLMSTYDMTTNEFAFSAKFGPVPGSSTLKTDAFWLVLSPGKNPKGTADELAILYFDAINPNNATLTAYAYNGVNGNNSFQTANARIISSRLDPSVLKAVTAVTEGNERTLGFKINAEAIKNFIPQNGNPANWTGLKYGPEKVGIWFHPTAGTTMNYSGGWLSQYSFKKEGWFDGENFKAVPEPMTMGLLAIGLAGIAARKRRKS